MHATTDDPGIAVQVGERSIQRRAAHIIKEDIHALGDGFPDRICQVAILVVDCRLAAQFVCQDAAFFV